MAGSEVTTFTSGIDLYDAMIEAIGAAEHTVFFESYIWKADDVGTRFKDALIAAAHRGVDVYVVYDAFANLVVPPPSSGCPSRSRCCAFRSSASR
ncbi:hypothetical protein [Mobilicoccus caccae]|uniref:Cardiolipin synthase n=1 Tax=Mobilicoccus caccae TaxID=1859295 RepID=A0ABQ6IM49_9MICO|nr:hypothetical protein [Mobilicoccus caccae]GMA39010.1 hypothetical protein GCM10025883_10550 [Mobilicoccus caccae]